MIVNNGVLDFIGLHIEMATTAGHAHLTSTPISFGIFSFHFVEYSFFPFEFGFDFSLAHHARNLET